MLIERCYQPRLETRIQTEVDNCRGETRTARLIQVSPKGLLMAADSALLTHIETPDPITNEVSYPLEMSVRFSLPGDEEAELSVRCRMVQKVRLSQHAYQIGLMILNMSAVDAERLREHIAQERGFNEEVRARLPSRSAASPVPGIAAQRG